MDDMNVGTQILENIGTILGVAFVYIAGYLITWWKNVKPVAKMKSNVDIILARIENIEQDVSLVKGELSFNGGSSLKDVVHSMKGTQEARFSIQLNQSYIPTYVADKDGELTFANQAMCDIFGMHYSDMRGTGWLLAVGESQKERDQIYAEWISSIKLDIPFEYEYAVTHQKTGVRCHCRVQVEAQRDNRDVIMFYVGVLTKMRG